MTKPISLLQSVQTSHIAQDREQLKLLRPAFPKEENRGEYVKNTLAKNPQGFHISSLWQENPLKLLLLPLALLPTGCGEMPVEALNPSPNLNLNIQNLLGTWEVIKYEIILQPNSGDPNLPDYLGVKVIFRSDGSFKECWGNLCEGSNEGNFRIEEHKLILVHDYPTQSVTAEFDAEFLGEHLHLRREFFIYNNQDDHRTATEVMVLEKR